MIKIIIFSIIFIFLIHNILNFLLETLTVSKTKDMIQIANQNYKNIYETLSQTIEEKNIKYNDDITPINSLPNEITLSNEITLPNEMTISNNMTLSNEMTFDENMKNELANYLREQINN